jgi:hypothetical protein
VKKEALRCEEIGYVEGLGDELRWSCGSEMEKLMVEAA